MLTHQRNPYTGTQKLLVIGIDVGTTFSGVSYALLQPGKVPRIQPVTQFSGQREEKPDSKVPSVVCYDQDGHVIAIGPGTDPEVNPMLSEDNVWRAEWFKLRLRPPHLAADKRSQLEKIWSPPEHAEDDSDASCEEEHENDVLLDFEPIGEEVIESETQNTKNIPRPVTDDFKTAVQVFTDFLQYLFKSATEHIIKTESHLDSSFSWSSIERDTYFVLTHPNGWEGKQQSQMREAAVAAGLVDMSTAAERITFVTEGEASLHFCLDKNPELHEESGGLLVVDCGGGTIELTAYSQTENGGYKELVSPDCLLQGSIFVTSRARNHFNGKFKDSQFGTDDVVEAMARAFDKPEGAKCMFDNPTTPYFVKFGHLRDNDRKYGVTNGKFKLEGAEVAKFFEPAIQDIIGGITNQCRNTKDGVSIKHILLVGGFGRSEYLYAKLRDYFKSSEIDVLRPDIKHLNKAVADGAVSYYVDRYVFARIARYSYGIKAGWFFNGEDTEHCRRRGTIYTTSNGNSYVPGFSTILTKGTTVTEEKQFREKYIKIFAPEAFLRWSMECTTVTCYKGQATSPPKWLDLEPDSFHDTCIIKVDMTNVKRNISIKYNGTGGAFYQFDFEVVILFGLTELKAYIAWQENGKEMRSDASIVYND